MFARKQGGHLTVHSNNFVRHGLKLIGIVGINAILFDHCRKSINRTGVCRPYKRNDAE